MSTKSGNNRTIFILYIPGGGIYGIIPAMLLSRLEQLTETPSGHLFQVFNGVSTGSILAAGLTVRAPLDPTHPKLDAEESKNLFINLGPKFFPPIPARIAKMIVANFSNLATDMLDPPRADANFIEEIAQDCEHLKKLAPAKDRKLIEKIESIATTHWLTAENKSHVLELCTKFRNDNPKICELVTHVRELVYLRSTTGTLSRVFRQSALKGLEICRKYWAKDFFYNSDVPKEHFRSLWGDTPMSQCLRSTYISAYNLQENRMETFSVRKRDMFSLDPKEPVATSDHDPKLWDAVMASIANPLAFRPYKMENGTICSDQAFIHTPLPCVNEILANKPKDADVRLVMLSTGKYISRKKTDSGITEEQERYGVAANLIRGKTTADIESYSMSGARTMLNDRLGADHIIEFSARLSPRDHTEFHKMPARGNILDASELNIKAIVRRAQVTLLEEDQKIRDLAIMLARNLHNIGQMDAEKLARVEKNAQIPYQLPPEDPDLEKLAAINRGEQMARHTPVIKRLFNSIVRGVTAPIRWLSTPAAEQNNTPCDRRDFMLPPPGA